MNAYEEWKRQLYGKLVENADLTRIDCSGIDGLRRILRKVTERLCGSEIPVLNPQQREQVIDDVLDLALRPRTLERLLIEAQGVIFNATHRPPSERIAYFSSLCPLRSGTILAGFQLGPAKHAPTSTVRLCRSCDGGSTWQEVPFRFETTFNGVPGSLAAAEMVEVEPGKLLMFTTWFDRSDPARPLFDPVTEGILHSKQLKAFSTDEGESWSSWAEVPTSSLTGCAMTGPVVQWSDGRIAFAFESFKEFDDRNPGCHAAWLLFSQDGGQAFDEPYLVAQHPDHKVYYWDQRLCPGKTPHDFVALFWTHDLKQKRDLTVHIRRAQSSYGSSFERIPIRATSIPGQIAAPLWLPDGRLLAFVVDRGRPGTLKLWQSGDGGLTWPKQDCLLVHTHDERAALTQGSENIDFKQYWEDMGKWSFGHPAIRSLGDGRVLLAYYAGTPTAMSIHWARVRV